MRISLNWLNDYINIQNIDAQAVADALTSVGIEVEGIEKVSTISGQVVVGKILQAEKHPDADKLRVCKVDIGQGEPLSIVCGAANAEAGLIACVATVGSVLPGDFKIKKSKIRGVESFGMMCAEDELGISDNHDNIISLDRSTPLGSSVADLFKLNDTVLTLSLTPNRADCLSYIGVARELSAKLGIPLNLAVAERSPQKTTLTSKVEVTIENAEDCARFCALSIEGLKANPSPKWLQQRLNAAGMRPINQIVDATNYVMLEYGQPIHAYDQRFIKDQKFVVRCAKPGESMKTLDGQVRKLEKDDLLICDSSGPIGLAGVMGAENSEVKEDTAAIIVEVANFNPIKIRKTAKRLGLHTEASHRFERGIDITIADKVAWRVGDLLQQIAKDTKATETPKVSSNLVDIYTAKPALARIALRPSRARKILGLESLDEKKIATLLGGLQLKQLDKAEDRILFEIPSWRKDLTSEIDLVEEVGRLNGYDNVPYLLPTMEIDAMSEDPIIAFLEKARVAMAKVGYSETINFPFVGAADLDKFELTKDHPWRKSVVLANPLTEDEALLRPSLVINLIKNIVTNDHQGQSSVKLFECGRGYTGADVKADEAYPCFTALTEKSAQLTPKAREEKRPIERNYLAAVLGQPFTEKTWQGAQTKASFFHGKAGLQSWLKSFGATDIAFVAADKNQFPFLHPGASACVMHGASYLGFVGELNPKVAQAYGLDPEFPAVVLEVDLERVYKVVSQPKSFDTTERKFPPVSRDLALIVARQTKHADLSSAISRFPKKRNLKAFSLFDVYQGDKVASDKKSLAYAFSFQSAKRTLNDQEVDSEIALLLEWLDKEVGAKLR